MYKRIVHYLQGSQLVQIQCACPERVLNLLGAKGILFWDLQGESEICLRLRMLLAQGPALEEIAGQIGAEMTVLRRRGIPVLWGRFHRRYVLLAGFAVFWLLLFGGNLFIWEFRVSGNGSNRCWVNFFGRDRFCKLNRTHPILPEHEVVVRQYEIVPVIV